MKKTILSMGLVMVALLVVGVGAVFAQGPTPATGNGPMLQNGAGYLHTYMVAAFAEKLSLQADDVNARLAAGESMYAIAITAGVPAENFSALMVEVRSDALSAAVEAGAITQEQADWMSTRGFGRGYGTGNCPMHSGQGQQLNRGAGKWNGNGRGMTLAPDASAGVGGGFGWQNQQTNP